MTPTAETRPASRSRLLRAYPWLLFGCAAGAVSLVLLVGHHFLGWTDEVSGGRFPVPDGFFGAWYRTDSLWYLDVATNGYSLDPGAQSNIVFFPALPLLVRVVDSVIRNPAAAGVLVSMAGGLASVLLLWKWLSDHVGARASMIGLALFVLYPYALYLYGPVYAEPICLAGMIGSFLLVDRDRFALAGVVGIVASGARLVGITIVPALIVALLDRRGLLRASGAAERRAALRRLRPADALVLLAAIGMLGYLTYLWVAFGDPLVLVRTETVAGWQEGLSVHSLLKIEMFRGLVEYPEPTRSLLVLQIALTVGFAALVPRVWRRFGPGYGTYTALVIAMPFMLSHDAYSMGRYLLLAFPVFAIVAEYLEDRPSLFRIAAVGSALLLLLNAGLYGDGYFVA